jgi:hypothetical protein
MTQKTSEEARIALIEFIADHTDVFENLKPERSADMLLAALWIDGFKLVPLSEEDKEDKEDNPESEP